MPEKPLDLSKPVQTRDGRLARIVCADMAGATLPVIALIKAPDSSESAFFYMADGRKYADRQSELDLVNAHQKQRRFLLRREIDGSGFRWIEFHSESAAVNHAAMIGIPPGEAIITYVEWEE